MTFTEITGVVTSGHGMAKTRMEQFINAGGTDNWPFEPIPGTLNLRVPNDKIRSTFNQETLATFDGGARGTQFRAYLNAVPCLVRVFNTQIEVTSRTHFRNEHGVKDGDVITLLLVHQGNNQVTNWEVKATMEEL